MYFIDPFIDPTMTEIEGFATKCDQVLMVPLADLMAFIFLLQSTEKMLFGAVAFLFLKLLQYLE